MNRFAYTVNQTPGYSFNYVTWFAGGADRYTTQSNISGRPGRDYSVHLSSNVNLIVETEGQGVVTSPHFKAGYNPRPYEQALYTQPAPTSLTPITNGNPVTMTPVPCPGWAFDHWEIRNANNEWVAVENPISGYPSPITVYMNWWTGAGIHVPENQSGLPVKAVFQAYCECSGPDGRDTLRAMYENAALLDQNNNQYTPRPECEEFFTDMAGHSQEYENPGNFSFQELSCNHGSLPDSHPHWQLDKGVSGLFQDVRDEHGSSITVTSAYRCPRKNNSIGSLATSHHAYGRAFDFSQGTAQGNWDVAQAAADAGVNMNRIRLYFNSSSYSFQFLTANGYSGSILPSGWTTYTNGHCDRVSSE